MNTRVGSKHQLAEFTATDLESMVRQGPGLRGEEIRPQGSGGEAAAASEPAD
jgi:hypothetical protein